MTAADPAAKDMRRRWAGQAWRDECDRWIMTCLGEAGIKPSGPSDQVRVTAWSTQLTVPTDHGTFWFKENCPSLCFEAGMVAHLAAVAPARVIPPVAVGVRRGWLLSPDGGPTVQQRGADAVTFGRILTEYAAFQRELAGHGPALARCGLQSLEVADTTDHVDRVVHELAALPRAHPLHADTSLLELATRYRGVIAAAANRLAEVAVPSTLQHNDLHAQNAFAAPGMGSLRFFDFGDAVWSHPFCSLFVTRYKLAHSWGCDTSDPRIGRLVDTYLDQWTDIAPLPELRQLVQPAMVIGQWHRYNAWHRLLPHFTDDELRRRSGYLATLMRTAVDGSTWMSLS